MNVYEIINPSDQCTCEAESLGVAAFSAILVCPRYGVKCEETKEEFFEFFGAVDAFTAKFRAPEKFLADNKAAIIACLESFCYESAFERAAYNRALELIDDPTKKQTYRDEWEDKRRTSMSKICKAAWAYAKGLKKKKAG